MSTTEQAVDCKCSVWALDDGKVRMCEPHHRYWLGAKELASVSSVLRVWPQEPCSSCGLPMLSDHVEGCQVKANFDHAHDRGVRVDKYGQEFVRTGQARIVAGEWVEVKELTEKLVVWLQQQKNGTPIETQVIVHDDEIAGTLDLRIDGCIADVKATYDAGGMVHRLQLGAYAALSKKDVDSVGIVQVTKRFKEAKWMPFDVEECIKQWRIVRAMWSLWKANQRS